MATPLLGSAVPVVIGRRCHRGTTYGPQGRTLAPKGPIKNPVPTRLHGPFSSIITIVGVITTSLETSTNPNVFRVPGAGFSLGDFAKYGLAG